MCHKRKTPTESHATGRAEQQGEVGWAIVWRIRDSRGGGRVNLLARSRATEKILAGELSDLGGLKCS